MACAASIEWVVAPGPEGKVAPGRGEAAEVLAGALPQRPQAWSHMSVFSHRRFWATRRLRFMEFLQIVSW